MPGPVVESISFNSSFRNETRLSHPDLQVRTPRPLPQLFQEQLTFSTKKEKTGTPKDALPPRPPVKSAPPISRIFPHNRALNKAQPVSFCLSQKSTPAIISPHYNEGSKELYFDQCFEIEQKLGAGSFGEVFKVRSKEDGKFYAVKRSRERFRGESDRKRKLEEVLKQEKLKHPNCVKFYKAWEEKQHLYILTELCQASLNNFADQNHNIPEKLVKNYMVDLLMAVKHLHDNDLVHMDIKPENIFVTEGVCKLGDFGLVLDLSSKDTDYSEAQEGDPKYLSPELLQGQFGKPADVFSLGITFLELASDLDLPRSGMLWQQLRQGHLPRELVHNVNPDLLNIMASMMEPNPCIRPTVDRLLQEPLIKSIWKQRRREQLLRSTKSFFNHIVQGVWCFFVTLWLTMTYPLHSLFPNQLHTPRKNAPQHPPDWDHSFSDDEVCADDSININNSMCAPLDFSTSSEDSVRDSDGFVIPNIPAKPRRIFSTSCVRHHPTRNLLVDGVASPLSMYSSSPVSNTSVPFNVRINDSITPNSSFHQSLLELEEDDVLDGKDIAPKNLLMAFDGSSSDED